MVRYGEQSMSTPGNNSFNYPVPPKDAIGYPSRDPDLDVLPGFKNPPRGYGQIPFYWWVGDKLQKDRLLWQLDKLKEKGITGIQINYPHFASRGWPTNPGEPEVLSDDWWKLWSWYVDEVKKRDMAVGLSDYTIHWENSHYYMDEIIKIPGMQGTKLNSNKKLLSTGETYSADNAGSLISVMAYQIINEQIDSETGIDLKKFIVENNITWSAPKGNWAVVEIYGTPTPLDPMNPLVGQAIVDKFLKPFEDKNRNESGKALNYFFQDEERMRGEEKFPWNASFAEEFRSRKGYDIIPYLPALFEDIGDITPKIRLDYHDVKAELIGNGYFKPIFEWCWSHGMIFGSDNNGRGTRPDCYGDYFRTQRFITAPGNDTPGRNSDLIKVKVNSSIAHLYQRPRVWLEGYHSSGWGTTLDSITIPTSENFVFGANLLSLHGLYYSTHGGWWEWAPPDFHFRMPYWDHEGVWLKYYERLSYLMSQGFHCCDVAIMYPVSELDVNSVPGLAYDSKMANSGQIAVDTAFGIGKRIAEYGIDFDFIDFESVNNSDVKDGKLNIAGERYRVLVLPAMSAIRSKTMEKVLEHYRAGGVVVAIGVLPSESDRVGRNDEKLDAMVKEIFGKTAAEVQGYIDIIKNVNANGGVGIFARDYGNISEVITEVIERDFIPLKEEDCSELGKGYVNHRKIGNRDVYMVRNVPKHSECFFKAKGKVELWNPWDGTTEPIYTFKPVEGGTIVRMPMESYQDNIIVFTPGEQGNHIEATDMDIIKSIAANINDTVTGYASTEGEKYAIVSIGNKTTVFKGIAKAPKKIAVEGMWDFELKPTLDNQWGDFRLPATREFIAAEARFFSYKEELEPDAKCYAEDYDDSSWERVTYSKGPEFWQFTPESGYDENAFINTLKDMKVVNADTAVRAGESSIFAREYIYSIRWGITDSSVPEQDWHHGLNCVVPNEFLTIAPDQDTYYWTTVYAPAEARGQILTSEVKPDAIWINGNAVPVNADSVQLAKGNNTLLLKYSNSDKTTKRAYFIIEDGKANSGFEKYPLAMDWFNKPGVYKFDAYPQTKPHVGVYRFTSPLGLRSMKITAYGYVRGVWVNGEEAAVTNTGKTSYGADQYEVIVKSASPQPIKVAIQIEQKPGYYKGAAIPEPIKLDCTSGRVVPGDWSRMGILESYSGGARYKKKIIIPQKEPGDKVILNLGTVAATAEVWVNGQLAGVLVCKPWRLDVSEFMKQGENDIEILVYNTLSNHYSTIPSRYSNFTRDAVSGLIGPVSIDIISPVILKSIDADH